MWHYFSVSKANQDGSLETFIIKVHDEPEVLERGNTYLRKRSPVLYDFPSIISLWAGYVFGETHDELQDLIEANF